MHYCAHGCIWYSIWTDHSRCSTVLGPSFKLFWSPQSGGSRNNQSNCLYGLNCPSWMDPSLHHPCVEGGPCQSVTIYMGQQARTQSRFLWCCASTSEKVENDQILGFFLKSNTHTKLMQSGPYQNSCRPLVSLDWTCKKKDVFPLRPSKRPM